MTVQIMKGDLLAQPADAIVNTVNCVGIMGKGIALQFKQKWPANFKAYAVACRAGEVEIGRMFVFDCGGLVRPHFIINFPTKKHWREKTKIAYIEIGLADLIEHVQKLNIRSIAIPPLGCGNGGLMWSQVRSRIECALSNLKGVEVFLFEPAGAPSVANMEINTKKPNMTPSRAAMIKLLSIYRELEYRLSSIEIQKLAYFLEVSGHDLNLSFTKHNYGPYSNKIWHVLKAMDGHYLEGVGDRTSSAEIRLLPNALSEAEEYIARSGDNELKQRLEQVASLIEGFETPYGMELLATVHWVAIHETKASTIEEAIQAVRDWNNRKQKLLQDSHVRTAWNRLKSLGWLRLRST